MEQKKIEELKKLIGFGLLIADRIKYTEGFEDNIKTSSLNELVPLLADCACAYDDKYDENVYSEFKEPQMTNILKKVHDDYLEFKKTDEFKKFYHNGKENE